VIDLQPMQKIWLRWLLLVVVVVHVVVQVVCRVLVRHGVAKAKVVFRLVVTTRIRVLHLHLHQVAVPVLVISAT
jgi:hypothetical protein